MSTIISNTQGNSTISSTDGLTMFYPRIRVSALTVAVRRETDLVEAKDLMPSEEVVSNGRKYVVEKGTNNELLRIRKATDRSLAEDGFRFLGGFAIPDSAVPARIQRINELQAEFEAEVNRLAPLMSELCRQQQEKHPEWAQILRDGALDEGQFRARCGFSVAIYTIAAPGPNAGKEAQANFAQVRGQAVPQLLEHVADEAKELLKRFCGDVQARVAIPIQRLVSKLKRFSFLDGRIAPVVGSLQSQLSMLPATGVMEVGSDGAGIALSLLHALSDPSRLLDDAQLLSVLVAPKPLFAGVQRQPEALVPPAEPLEVPALIRPPVAAQTIAQLNFRLA